MTTVQSNPQSNTPSNPTNSKAAWHRPFARPAKPFGPTELQVLSGQIPGPLQGTYFQNGTGRLERGGQPVGHWFDGDGAILQVQFAGGQATGRYRYVETAGYRQEDKAGKYCYGNYGMRHPGPLWQHLRDLFGGQSPKNSANTSVLALSDRLLALWEGGNPHRLDLETLETVGKDDLGWLGPTQAFSAHPLQDPMSGEIYNIGVSPQCELMIYRCNRACRLIKQRKIALKSTPLLHSFALASRYLVFLISPVALDVLPLLVNQKPYADVLKWQPGRPTRILIVDRDSLNTVADIPADPWFQWHIGNGCELSDGSVRLDFVRFDNFTDIHEVLREIPSGEIKTKARGQLWQLRLDPRSGRVLSNQCVVDQNCEFPQVPAAHVGHPWQKTFLLMNRSGVKTGEDWFGAVGYYDYEREQLTRIDLGEGVYGSEPLVVNDQADQDWLMMPVFNADQQRSELWIWESQSLSTPVCCLALPQIVAMGFHGTWHSL